MVINSSTRDSSRTWTSKHRSRSAVITAHDTPWSKCDNTLASSDQRRSGAYGPARLRAAEPDLGLYNDTWRQDDDDELDHDGFIARITPTNVDIDVDVIQIYFNDGGLFAGHSLVLLLDTDLQVLDVKLAG